MKRSAPLKRTAFKHRQRKLIGVDLATQPGVTVLARMEPVPGRIVCMAAINDADFRGAMPKTEPQRCPALLAMARGQRRLLQVFGVCRPDPATTVACHSNQSAHGEAGVRKADDQWRVYGCAACHRWPTRALRQRLRRPSASRLRIAGWSTSGGTSWPACRPHRLASGPRLSGRWIASPVV